VKEHVAACALTTRVYHNEVMGGYPPECLQQLVMKVEMMSEDHGIKEPEAAGVGATCRNYGLWFGLR